jgi:hypothetical protein
MRTPAHGKDRKRGGKSFKMTKRIGLTTYKVTVHFSQTSKETIADKLIRLIEHDAQRDDEGA